MGFLEQFRGSCNFSVLLTMVCLENIENKIKLLKGERPLEENPIGVLLLVRFQVVLLVQVELKNCHCTRD